MKKTLIVVVLAGLLAILTASAARAQKFVGTGKCKVCHAKDELGNQHAKWLTTKHAKAFATLSTPEAKAAAKKVGVTDPAKDMKCLICHTTGAEAAEADRAAMKIEDGVSCEACHGPGEKYKSKEVHGTDRKAALAAGMIDAKALGEAVCKRCHVPDYKGNKNPSYQPFDYATFQPKIDHPRPKK